MKKADIKLIICLVLVGLSLLIAVLFCTKEGKTVVITQNNKQVYSGPISENKTVDLGTNVIEIKNSEVDVTSAVCENQVCVKHKKIHKKGEQIACIPNKIIITVE